MKKGHMGIIIAGVIIGIIIGFLIGYYTQQSKIDLISQSNEDYKNDLANQKQVSDRYLNLLRVGEEFCTLDSPFSCASWKIIKDQISLQITNKGDKDYNLVTIRLENCGEVSSHPLKAGETKTFDIGCIITKKVNYKEIVADYDGKSVKGYIYFFY